MLTTTELNTSKGDLILISLDKTYNEEAHQALSSAIHKIATHKQRTNQTLSVEDLKQDAWTRIYEIIDAKLKQGVEVNVRYLAKTAFHNTLGNCQKESRRLSYIDDFASNLMSVSDGSMESDSSSIKLNVAKSKLEYELSLTKPDEAKSTDLRLSLENILENIDNTVDDDVVARNIIVIQYVKQHNGDSKKINNLYEDIKSSLDSDKLQLLDDMDKFTRNAAFKIFGMRATDNRSSRIRERMKELMIPLR